MRQYHTSTRTAISVLVIALVLALYLFANSSFFETDIIEWSGLEFVSAQQLEIYLDLGVINVWRLDSKALAATLTQHPWVDTVKIAWRWPNRIVVRVMERSPLAQIPTAGGWMLLDGEGQLLPPTQGSTVHSLPVITGLDINSLEQRVAAARLMSNIPVKLIPMISEWNVSTRTFITRAGVEILMGQPVDLEDKFILLEKILDDLALRGEQANKIDLRVPKNPVVSIM